MEGLKEQRPIIDIMSATMTSELPVELGIALGHMQRIVSCPEEVKARIAALRVPTDDLASRGVSTNWRTGSSGGAGSGAPRAFGSNRAYGSGGGYRTSGSVAGVRAAPVMHGSGRGAPPRFGNRARKEATVEERMMDRIRDKLNKFSEMTYDIIKGWLCELLDSGEAGFLSDFITLVFEKAAMEPPFCALYARLLTELRSSFPHLNTELTRIYREFIAIFEEVRDEPPVGSDTYDAFVEQRGRRKYRRGYANFIGEIARLGAVGDDDLVKTCTIILAGLVAAKKEEGKQLLCEEYADCLTSMMKSGTSLLKPHGATLAPLIREAMDRKESPSLSNKARFSLMDLVDIYG
jgi:hypothetical protein